jgi:putative sigma-54 modulation protein
MQINVSGHHVEVTSALRDYVVNKLSRLERHFDNISIINVTLKVEKPHQKVEAKVNVSGAEIFAQSESQDMYTAIDLLADKLDRQVLKHKEKLIGRKQRQH